MHEVTHSNAGSGSLEPWQRRTAELVLAVLALAAAFATLGPAPSPGAAPASVTDAERTSTNLSASGPAAVPASGTDRARVVQAAAPAAPIRPRASATAQPTARPTAQRTPRTSAARQRPAAQGRRTVGVGSDPRVVPARSVEGSSQQATVRNILTTSFKARKGDRRLIAAQVKAYQPENTPDPLLLASTSLSCTPAARRVRSSSATVNVQRGESTWLSTAFVYVAPETGTVRCVVRAYGSRPRPRSSDGTGYNRWYAWHGSRLYLGSLQPHWSASASKPVRSRLIGRNQTTSTLSRFAAGSSTGKQILLVTDHKVTTCSSARGSRDATTGGRELCRGHVRRTGSRVRLVVRVLQGEGRGCTPRPVVDKVFRITVETHHRMIRGLEVLDPARTGCRGRLTVSTTLKNVGGAPVMVQTSDGRTSIAQG